MKIYRSALIACVAGATMSSLAVPALAQSPHVPRISMAAARATATKRIDGAVLSQEYESEGGRWIYTFDIRPKGETGKRIVEVNVEADDGRVVNVHTEGG